MLTQRRKSLSLTLPLSASAVTNHLKRAVWGYPHPSNPNYKYLRAATSNGSDMQNFCIICHRMKADPTVAAKKVKIFNSMDETRYKEKKMTKKSKKPKKKAN
jgi:hypothetical protein